MRRDVHSSGDSGGTVEASWVLQLSGRYARETSTVGFQPLQVALVGRRHLHVTTRDHIPGHLGD